MWSGLVARKMCSRDREAPRSAATLASMSSWVVRQSEATVTPLTAPETAATPAKSPGDDAANPASITSTPRRSSVRATSAFSSGCSAMPGDCSPSLSVVSKILILRTRSSFVGVHLSGNALLPSDVGVCGVSAA